MPAGPFRYVPSMGTAKSKPPTKEQREAGERLQKFLQPLILKAFESEAKFCGVVGVSRQAAQSWWSKAAISADKIYKVAKALHIWSDEILAVLAGEEPEGNAEREAIRSVHDSLENLAFMVPSPNRSRALRAVEDLADKPTIGALQRVSALYGISPWVVLHPNIDRAADKEEQIAHIIRVYLYSDPAGRRTIVNAVATAEAEMPAGGIAAKPRHRAGNVN